MPELELHLSTQACVTSSADVEAARALGVRRVVLARSNLAREKNVPLLTKLVALRAEVHRHQAKRH